MSEQPSDAGLEVFTNDSPLNIIHTFTQDAIRTESPHFYSSPLRIRLLHAALGLTTEASEFADVIKKALFYNKPIDIPNLIEELGDGFWYAAIAIEAINTDQGSKITLEEVLTKVIDKLKVRFPDQFSNNKAINRDLVSERKVLES